jgi:hypothetical protein
VWLLRRDCIGGWITADATGGEALLHQQLPLHSSGCPVHYLTQEGLLATGAGADAASSTVALQTLQQQKLASAEQGSALHASLLQVGPRS